MRGLYRKPEPVLHLRCERYIPEEWMEMGRTMKELMVERGGTGRQPWEGTKYLQKSKTCQGGTGDMGTVVGSQGCKLSGRGDCHKECGLKG